MEIKRSNVMGGRITKEGQFQIVANVSREQMIDLFGKEMVESLEATEEVAATKESWGRKLLKKLWP